VLREFNREAVIGALMQAGQKALHNGVGAQFDAGQPGYRGGVKQSVRGRCRGGRQLSSVVSCWLLVVG